MKPSSPTATKSPAAIALPFLEHLVPLAAAVMLFGVPYEHAFAWKVHLVTLAVYLLSFYVWRQCVAKGEKQQAAAVVFAVAVLAVFATANNPSSLVIVCLGVVIVGLSISCRASIIYCVVPTALVGGVHIAIGSEWGQVATEVLATGFMVAVGIALTRITYTAAEDALKKQAHAEQLRIANDQLRQALEKQRELTLAEERERIASSLHDGLGHRLTAVILSLDYARRVMGKDVDKAQSELTQARRNTVDALDDMRMVVRALHPIQLESESFVSALQSLSSSFSSTALTVNLTIEEPERVSTIPSSMDHFLLAATQEALTNVVRHGHGVSEVDIDVLIDDQLVLRVADNGPGDDKATQGFGLRSLSHRAAELGGSLKASSHGGIDGGFALTISLPLISAATREGAHA